MFFVTSIHYSYQETARQFDSRCFGYFEKFSEAKNAVLKNRGDIQECLYNYVVIEYIKQGIHAESKEELWFYWRDSWQICGKPQEFKGLVNWAIG